MRLGDVWTEAANIARTMAAAERANARKAASLHDARVAHEAMSKLYELANVYTWLAMGETRDEPTEVDVVVEVFDDGPTQPT